VLASAATAQGLLDAIAARERTVPDQWQVQVLARLLTHARVGLHSTYLDDAALASSHLFAVPDIAEAVRAELAAVGSGALVCVLPEGPQTIPYLDPAR
jgi:hypothetical protein